MGNVLEAVPNSTYAIEGHILDSFHQGDSRFGATAGVQCACNSLFAICWSVIRKVSLWQSCDMDHMLVKGDGNYKLLGTFDILSVDELVSDEEFSFSVEFMSLENSEISANSVDFPFLRAIYNTCVDRGDGFLMFLSGFTIQIIPYRNFFYFFHSHSRNGELIANGKPVLLKFSHLEDIEIYIQVVYMQQRSQSHTYFQIQCVKINISIENKLMVLSNFQRKRRNTQRMSQRKAVRERSLNFKSSASNSIKRLGDLEK